MKNPFSEIVGQTAVKQKLLSYLEIQQKTKVMRNLMFNAAFGTGKTTLARLTSFAIKNSDGQPREMLEVSSGAIKSKTAFFDQIVQPYVLNKEITLFFDEASELEDDLSTAFLSILNPNTRHQNDYWHDGQKYTFDFSRVSFIFATTDAQKVNRPLMDRLVQIELDPYKISEIGEIIKRAAKGLAFPDGIIKDVALSARVNPRNATMLANDIKDYMLGRGDALDAVSWENFKLAFGVRPMGISANEAQYLNILDQRTYTKPTQIASKLNMNMATIRNSIERYPQYLNLINVEPEGRSLTLEGRRVLALLNA